MISEAKQLRILKLYATGKHSRRQIAQAVDVARETVAAVIHRGTVVSGGGALGTRPEFGDLEVSVYRCPGCGVRVKLRPCLICRARG